MIKRLIKIFEEYLDEEVNETSLIKDFNLSEIEEIDLIMDLEDEFDIEYEYDDLSEFGTIGDLLNYLKEY